MSRLTKGYLIAFGGISVWSTTGIFISYLVTTYAFPALQLAAWRGVLACAAMIPLMFIIRRSLLKIQRSMIRFYVFYGLLLAVFNSIWTLSVQANGAAVATVLAYSSAGFTAVLAWLIFKESLSPFKIVAVALSLLGCLLVSNAYSSDVWNLNPIGVITGLLSGVLFACYNMMGKEASQRELNTWTTLLYTFIFSTLFIMIFNLFPQIPGTAGSFDKLVPTLPLEGWAVLLMLSLVPTILGFGLYNASMNYLPASIASLLATTEPAMTAVLAYLFLNERLSAIQIVGSLIILSAVIVVRFDREPTSEVASAL